MGDRETDELLARFAELRAALPWHRRLKWAWEDFYRFTVRKWLIYLPGYRVAMLRLHRVRRQGISGLWTPIFDIRKQDFSAVDKRLRWHGWGVLRGQVGFGAWTPTGCKGLFDTPADAWRELERIYWGRP